MKALLGPHLIADSDDIVEQGGYHYFPRAAVRLECLVKAARIKSDRACPHGVQFYDVHVAGVCYERAAWSYEAPGAAMAHVGHRIGFWQHVKVG